MPRFASLFTLLLLAPALAGCLANPDLQPGATLPEAGVTMADRAGVPTIPAELAEIRPFEASAPDGAALRGHLYLPKGDGPFATVLVFIPYWNHGGGIPSDGMTATVDGRRTMAERMGLQALMDAGFAVALVNTRGSGLSDGCYQYMDHADNGPDANAVVDALAAQEWSNGNVGMYGISYGGATQFAALASGASPSLKAVVPVSGEWDEWNLLGRWGAATTWAAVHPSYRHASQGLGATSALVGLYLGAEPYRPTPEHLCPETVEHTAHYEEFFLTGDKTPFMRERDLRDGLRTSAVPIFATNGMTDGEGHILQFEGLWDLIPHDKKRLMVGQWPHAYPFGDAMGFTEEHVVPWFDHFLRDGPPVPTGIATYEDNTGAVHESTAWPPAEANLTPLYLSGDALVTDPARVVASDQVTVATDLFVPVPDACPGDEAVYASPPLAEDALIAGNFFVNLTLTSTEANENVAALLWTAREVPPCGAGMAMEEVDDVYGLESHRHALSDLRHRGHLEQGRDFPVGEPGVMEMRSVPLAEVLPAGSRIILAVKGGHPDLAPRPGVPTLTFHTGPDLLGELWLPVVGGELRFEDAVEGPSGVSVEVSG